MFVPRLYMILYMILYYLILLALLRNSVIHDPAGEKKTLFCYSGSSGGGAGGVIIFTTSKSKRFSHRVPEILANGTPEPPNSANMAMKIHKFCLNTVDGQNPAPPRMRIIP